MVRTRYKPSPAPGTRQALGVPVAVELVKDQGHFFRGQFWVEFNTSRVLMDGLRQKLKSTIETYVVSIVSARYNLFG